MSSSFYTLLIFVFHLKFLEVRQKDLYVFKPCTVNDLMKSHIDISCSTYYTKVIFRN